MRGQKLFSSFKNAFQGIKSGIQTERNIRIHFTVLILVILLGFYLHLTRLEWAIIALAAGLVLVAEYINTAIETILDLLHPENNPSVGKAKDLAAGAVLIASIIAIIAGAYVFVPRIWGHFQ